MQYNRFLTIAGSDSGGGAGIQADIKTAEACGCFAMSVITAVTAQNTVGVKSVHIVPSSIVKDQIDAVLSDIGADAIKLGMLPTPEIIDVVADAIIEYKIKNVVLDPVMIATSGDRLVSEEAVSKIVSRLLPLSRVVTPNVPEAEFITGAKLHSATIAEYAAIAAAFRSLGARGILLKSGHVENDNVIDYLFDDKIYQYPYNKIITRNTHGTGCTLSSAVAAFLARGFTLCDAVESAENYIREAIAAGAEYEIGSGHGPVYHNYKGRR